MAVGRDEKSGLRLGRMRSAKESRITWRRGQRTAAGGNGEEVRREGEQDQLERTRTAAGETGKRGGGKKSRISWRRGQRTAAGERGRGEAGRRAGSPREDMY